tara:strand:+ start:23758 stop:24066 length:309 start_codon:yes stop_codon:yes gene_type:complete
MTEITDPKVKKILEQYERKRMREKERYERIKETEEFKNKNRERARNHYNLNKEVKKNNYMENRDLLNARSSYYYYKRNDRLEDFKQKYPEKIELLSSINLLI